MCYMSEEMRESELTQLLQCEYYVNLGLTFTDMCIIIQVL
jgi:hypothetical protein